MCFVFLSFLKDKFVQDCFCSIENRGFFFFRIYGDGEVLGVVYSDYSLYIEVS